MSDYDYLNARVRGMSRHLLDRDTFDELLASSTEDVILDVLLESSYGEELRSVMGSGHKLPVIEDAIRRSLSRTVRHVLSLAPERPRALLGIQLNRWDVQNIITILRGKLRASTRDEILTSLVPAGQFRLAQLEELSAEDDVLSVADALTTWNYEFAYPIRRAIRENARSIEPAQLETTLFLEYFQWAFSRLSDKDENEAILRNHLRMQADLMNVIGSLQIVSAHERHVVEQRIERIPGGFLVSRVLDEIESQPNVATSLEILEGTYFAPAIERGILVFGQTNQLSVLERFLETVIMEKGMKLFRGGPFTVAVPLGYIWRKVNEYINLRLVLRGTVYHMPPNIVREEMFFA